MARVYELSFSVNRGSPAEALLVAFRKVAQATHPNKGGQAKHFRELQAASEKWGEASKKPRQRDTQWVEAEHPEELALPAKCSYRVHAACVPLSNHGVADMGAWRRFVTFVQESLEGVWRFALARHAGDEHYRQVACPLGVVIPHLR